jgi:hypothetical protein
VPIIALAESVRSANSGNGHNEKEGIPKKDRISIPSVLVYFKISTPPFPDS